MKKLILGLAILTFLPLSAAAQSRIIERPVHGLTDIEIIELERIEITTGSTLFYFHVHDRKMSFAFGNDLTLEVGGEVLNVSQIKDLTVFKGLPDDAPFTYVVEFPALPKKVVSGDLAGSVNNRRFRIWDIDLTGKMAPYRPQLPEGAFAIQPKGRECLPDPQMKIAKTTFNIHLTGIKEGYDCGTLLMGASNPFSGVGRQYEPTDISQGVYTFSVEKYASGRSSCLLNDRGISILANPGETVDIWIDITAMNLRKSRLRSDPAMPWIYFEGDFAAVNNSITNAAEALDPQPPQFPQMTRHLDLHSITGRQYIEGMMQRIKDETAAIESMRGISGEEKEARIMDRVTKCLWAVKEIGIMMGVYHKDEVVTLETQTDFLYLLNDALLNNPKLIYGVNFSTAIPPLAVAAGRAGITDKFTDSDNGWMHDWRVFPILAKVDERQFVTPDEEIVIAESQPYYRELYEYQKQKIEAEYRVAMQSGKFVIHETPECGDADDLLGNIVAQYPGKVVFVDFWATWCGPCINGMRALRPLKPEMKEHDVVSVYITTESSPVTRWTLSLPDIGGEHYYLSNKEWTMILEKYGFKAIPTYMIFDKQGTHCFQATGFPGVERLRTELEKIW